MNCTAIRRWACALAACVLVGAPFPAFAQVGETFEDALVMAYDSNPALDAARAQLRATEEQLTQAWAGRLPTVDASLVYNLRDTSSDGAANPFFDSDGRIGTNVYGVTAEQILYGGGAVSGAIKAARAQVEAGRADLITIEQDILLQAVGVYVDVLRAQEVVDIRANNVQVLSRQLRAARDRFEVGEVTRTDVSQAEARLASARSELARAQADLAALRAAYVRVIGMQPGSLSPPPPLPDLPYSQDQVIDAAVRRNPQVVSARFAETAARAGVTQAQAGLKPRVTLSGSAQRTEYADIDLDSPSADTSRFLDTDDITISARLSVPLFAGGLNSSRVREAREQSNATVLQLRNAERVARATAIDSWSNLEAARFQIESSRQAVRANTIAFEGVEQEARVGLRTTLDVLDAEQELLNAKLSLVSAERDLYVAHYQVLQAVGDLTARNLGLQVRVAQNDSYVRRLRRLPLVPGVVDWF